MCVLAMAIPLAEGMLRWVGFLCRFGKVEVLGGMGGREGSQLLSSLMSNRVDGMSN